MVDNLDSNASRWPFALAAVKQMAWKWNDTLPNKKRELGANLLIDLYVYGLVLVQVTIVVRVTAMFVCKCIRREID